MFSHTTTLSLVVHIYFLHTQEPNTVDKLLSSKLNGCTGDFKGLKESEVYKRKKSCLICRFLNFDTRKAV